MLAQRARTSRAVICECMGTTLTIPPPGAEAPPRSQESALPSPWIYRPWIDLLVGCGGWSAPLLLLAFYAASSYTHAWTIAFYFLALLFNYPHFMATVYRAYHTQTEFAKYRIFTVHVAVLLALAGVIAHVWYPLLPWIFTLYICWSPWHYTGQNFGLLMMFARRAGLSPTTGERRALRLSFVASYLLLMLSFQTGTSGDALVLSLGLPAKFTVPARLALALFFVAASAWSLASLARRSSLRAVAAPVTLAATQFFWFLLPVLIELLSGHELLQTRYSSGILAVLHSTQYLWITSYYQEREARAAGNAQWRFSRYLVTLIAGGIALFIPGPWIVSRLFHADFAASFLTFTALVNIHHFLLDGALWKLRDSRIAALLLDSRDKTADAGASAQNRFLAATRWLAGPSASGRALRIATVFVLFGWAAVDQLHFYWSSKADSITALQRAAKLNPDDSAVQMRLARAETSLGRHDAALAALQQAACVNPGNLSLQSAYVRGMIENGRDVAAYEQYQKILTRWPRDADALINYGLLAHRLGHDEEAVDSWQRAVDAHPAQSNAQLYLAQALDQRGEMQAAARHYRAYLRIVAAHHEEHVKEGSGVLAALVKVADADAVVNHASDAKQGYDSAINFAGKAGDRTMQSLALVHLADLQEKQGDIAAAAQSYQRALALDASLSDPKSAASDWVNYGQFLRRQRQPERLVFACFLRAEDLVRDTPGDELSAVVQARTQSEVRLGRAAAEVRSHQDAAANEAAAQSASSFKAKI
jgi:tetratricopeptide (TPR) repeat protein